MNKHCIRIEHVLIKDNWFRPRLASLRHFGGYGHENDEERRNEKRIFGEWLKEKSEGKMLKLVIEK